MLQAFRKILKNANVRNHETFSERLLKGSMKVAHNHSKDYEICVNMYIISSLLYIYMHIQVKRTKQKLIYKQPPKDRM